MIRSRQSDEAISERSKKMKQLVFGAVSVLFVLISAAAPKTKEPAKEPVFAFDDYRYPNVQAPYAETKPAIDGVIGDGEWAKAVMLNALRSKDRMMSERQTAFWFQWDEDNFYVAMRSPLRKGEHLLRNLRDTERDINAVFDDAYEVFIGANSKSPDGQPVFFQYLSNFDNARYDAMHEPRVGNRRESWTANWEVKNTLNEKLNAWEMEMRIPRATIYRDPFRAGEVITMLIARDYKNPWEQNSFEGTSDFSVLDTHAHVKLVRDAPVVKFLNACDPVKRTFGLELAAYSPKDVTLDWTFQATDGLEKKGSFKVKAGETVRAAGTALDWLPETERGKKCRITVRNGDEVLLDWLTESWFQTKDALKEQTPPPADTVGLSVALNPIRDYIRVSADYVNFAKVAQVSQAVVTVKDAARGDVVTVKSLPLDDRLYTRGFVNMPGLKNGEYAVTIDVLDKDGKALRAPLKSGFVKKDATKFPFWRTKCGNWEKVLDPWTPVRGDAGKVSVWGRDMAVGAAGLPKSFVSQGDELLAKPMALEAEFADGTKAVAELDGKAKKTFDKDFRKTFETTSKVGSLAVRTKSIVEYDGMYKVEMTIEPPKGGAQVKSLRMRLPLAAKHARYVYGKGAEIRSGFDMRWLPEAGDKDGVIWTSRRVDSNPMWVGDFIPYVWVGDDKAGLCWFADSDRGWVPNDDVPAIQMYRAGKGVDVVFNLISSDFTIDAPRTVVFAFEGSPVKPLAPDARTEGWWCGYTFKFGWGSWVYPECGGDLIWQSRVNTVDPVKCRKHVLEHRKAGCLAVPYFEYNTMENVSQKTLPDPASGVTRDKPLDLNGVKEYFGDAWKMDSGSILCYCDSFQDFVIWNLDDWIKTSDIDGWYLDNVRPCYTANIEDGYGYRLPDGRVQPEYNMFQMRKFFLRLRAVFQENGKKRSHIVNHMTNNMILPWNGACDVGYDGEANVIFFGQRKDGVHPTDFMDVWTEERLFTAYPGMWGVNVNFMHEYQGDWHALAPSNAKEAARMLDKVFRAYDAAVMLYDALPTGNHNDDPRNLPFWKVRTAFGIDDPSVRFVPFWDGEELGLVSKTKGVKTSAWVKDGKGEALVIVTNWNGDDKPAAAKIELDLKKLGLSANAVATDVGWCPPKPPRVKKGETPPPAPQCPAVGFKKGVLTLDVPRHDYRLIKIAEAGR